MTVGEGWVIARVDADVAVGAPVHPDGSVVVGTVEEVIYLGAMSLFHIDVPGLGQLLSQRMSHEDESAFGTGDRVSASWELPHTLVLE